MLAQGQPASAVAVLRAALATITPDTVTPGSDATDVGLSPRDVIAAASVYATALDPHEGGDWLSLRWARHAYHASRSTHGADHTRTLHTAEVLARVLTSYRLDDEAIILRQQLCEQRTHRDGPTAATTVAARIELAILLHSAGHCTDAITALITVWTLWAELHGAGHPDSIAIRMQLAALLATCGDDTAAAWHTAQAYRDYWAFPRPDSDAAQPRLAVRWLGEPDDDHHTLCGRYESSPSESAATGPAEGQHR
ncbi:hypothetical protein KZZ52_33445 [Dactylosporangium sp. AC04546]|uniref:hypothetical protein n=1 Tax=Dactylosporangium sp. AC04546 TaxID=2862460 RepID=UPI002E7BBC53|nr:hypothetical protein [Dactylosporangium sp. AC04546]WVK78884.1 hypothetical protein KZZ52_33445 [Dactylosporangium sp. AC04546]